MTMIYVETMSEATGRSGTTIAPCGDALADGELPWETGLGGDVATLENEDVGHAGMDLSVEREDINFYNVASDRLRIEVRVRNNGHYNSKPETMELQFAAFGAFVPWKPLQKLTVPRIGAGTSTLVSTEAKIEPDGSLVAVDGSTPLANPQTNLLQGLPMGKKFKSSSTWKQLQSDPLPPASKPYKKDKILKELKPHMQALQAKDSQFPRADLHQGRSVHWVGNINVLIGNIDVERHEARAFRIYPDKVNRSWFFLGGGNKEAFKFELSGSGYDWSTDLYYTIPFHRLNHADQQEVCKFTQGFQMKTYPGKLIDPGEWSHLGLDPVIAIEISPPEYLTEGGLEIEVCRQSDNRKAVVEFDFSETAAGPGCYTD